MKIASAELDLASSHASLQRREVSESLRMWVGPTRPDFENRGQPPIRPATDQVTLSDAGRAAAARANQATDEASASDEAVDDALDQDPRARLIRMLVKALTGEDIRVIDAEELHGKRGPEMPALNAPPSTGRPPAADRPAGFGIEYDYRESYTEAQTTRFSASGSVTTTDGQEIRFQVELSMSRLYHEERSVSLRLGDAARKIDPLVLNFNGTAASLIDQRFSFDLDADGNQENIARLASGSAYLVFDRNADGRINDGSEMFGPTTGNGFAELSTLDGDDNGWIDENDAAYAQLKVWTPGAGPEGDNGELRSLAEANVGALALGHVATPFDLKNDKNNSLGTIRTSGIFLHEDGRAGTIQQIDLSA